MDAPGWLIQGGADVPAGTRWLGEEEQRVLARLHVEARRAAWLLGRWTGKAALGAWIATPPSRIQILAAHDGAPEVWVDGERLPVSVSLSHRGGRALAVVADAPQAAGCDLEAVEPRSGAFVREWLAPVEQALVSDQDARRRAQLVNLLWTAKEAAAKVRREGLRMDVRRAVVTPAWTVEYRAGWRPLRVDWGGEGGTTMGWWRAEPGWVMAVAAEPPPDEPRLLTAAR